jgi:Fe-S-cluster containining protein
VSARDVQQRLQGAVDQLVGIAREQGAVVPCGAGCWWCCAEPVYAGRNEVELIVARIRGMPAADQARIEAGVRDVVQRLAASPLLADDQPSALEYRKLRLVCPLLADGLCTVYEYRPISCRLHLVKDSPDGCREDALRPQQQFLVVPDALHRMTGALFLDAREMDHLVLLLHRVLFGDAPDSGARTAIVIDP